MVITFSSHRNRLQNYSVYNINLHGQTLSVTVTHIPWVVENWLNTLLDQHKKYLENHSLVVALGVHGPPLSRADVMQLCVGNRCLIFQISRAQRVPINLRTFLQNPNYTFIGFWNYGHRSKLRLSVHSLELRKEPLNLTRHLNRNFAGSSMEPIVDALRRFRIKGLKITDWSVKFLSLNQVLQASTEVFCAFLVSTSMSHRNVGKQKST